MDQAIRTPATADEITFREILIDIWQSKVLILCLMFVCAVTGALVGKLSDKEYEASVLLAAVNEEGVGGKLGSLGALASQYSGLASLAGINLQAGSKKEESVAVLQSDLLTGKYIRDNNLLPTLYARLWDPVAQKWRVEDPRKIPTVWKANRFFKYEIRNVTDDRKTGLIKMTIRWTDPVLAARWANDLVKVTNSYLREKAIQEAQNHIAYLNEQAAKTAVVEAQKAIYALLEQEINKEMLARGREEYALRVVDPAFVPEKPSSAGGVLLGVLGLMIGWLLGIIVVFGRRALRV